MIVNISVYGFGFGLSRKGFFFAAIKILFYWLFAHKTKTVDINKEYFYFILKKTCFVCENLHILVIRKKPIFHVFTNECQMDISFSMLNKL